MDVARTVYLRCFHTIRTAHSKESLQRLCQAVHAVASRVQSYSSLLGTARTRHRILELGLGSLYTSQSKGFFLQ